MPSKKEEGRARKAENENKKKEAAAAAKVRADRPCGCVAQPQ